MKWTVTCVQNQQVDHIVKYAVEAKSKEEAGEIYNLEGIVIDSKPKVFPVIISSHVMDISPYKRKDEESLYMLIVKYCGVKHPMILEKDLTYEKIHKLAKEWKESLEEENMLGDSNEPKADKLFIMKQEPNFGEEIYVWK